MIYISLSTYRLKLIRLTSFIRPCKRTNSPNHSFARKKIQDISDIITYPERTYTIVNQIFQPGRISRVIANISEKTFQSIVVIPESLIVWFKSGATFSYHINFYKIVKGDVLGQSFSKNSCTKRNHYLEISCCLLLLKLKREFCSENGKTSVVPDSGN